MLVAVLFRFCVCAALATGFFSTRAAGAQTWRAIDSPVKELETVTVDPSDEAVLYVTSSQKGLYVTRDGGRTWSQPLTSGVTSLALDPKMPAKVYAATYYQGFSRGQVHASSDRGLTWRLLGTFTDPIQQVLVTARGVLIAAPRNTTFASGIERSSDGGTTWTHHKLPTDYLQIICWSATEDPVSGYLYLSTEIANHPQPYKPPFFRSKDGGVSWEDVTGTLPWHVLAIEIVNQVVFALSEGAGLFQSNDFGVGWQQRNVPFHMALLAHPQRPGHFYGGAHTFGNRRGGAYLSMDAGSTWAEMGLDGKIVGRLALSGSGTRLYAATYGDGLFVTELGEKPAPAVGSVVNGASFQPGIQPGSWVTIQGANLANTFPGRTWKASEIVNGRLPASLDGVSVTINGKAAFVYYISPAQINVQAPDDTARGPANVVVTNNGMAGPPGQAPLQAFSPAFFQYAGTSYAIATRYPDNALIGNPAVVPGTVAARPNDILVFWGTGFGETNPAVEAGTAAAAIASVKSMPVVTLGNIPVTVIGAALSPGSAGLYQIAVQLPGSPSTGVVGVRASAGGYTSPAGVVTFVSK
jgi:uncharacterized protein (TIGR03437 family)